LKSRQYIKDEEERAELEDKLSTDAFKFSKVRLA